MRRNVDLQMKSWKSIRVAKAGKGRERIVRCGRVRMQYLPKYYDVGLNEMLSIGKDSKGYKSNV